MENSTATSAGNFVNLAIPPAITGNSCKAINFDNHIAGLGTMPVNKISIRVKKRYRRR